MQSISESVYASGVLKSKDQYQVFSTVNGIAQIIYVREGDTIKKGTPICTISNETQQLNKENAALQAAYVDYNANLGKINEARQAIEMSRNKMKNDSALYFRQSSLWQQGIGTKVELELRELNYENAKAAVYAATVRYDDLRRQLNFTSEQAKKNLLISSKIQGDYTIKSELDGIVYSLTITKGELVTPQKVLAEIGDAKNFILEMQVDEYDIFKIKIGLPVLVTLDSYKGNSYEASVTRIYPLMNERSKTFLVEAVFNQPPPVLYPNITFEANIVIQSKAQALLIPRDYLINDSTVVKSNNEKTMVKTGLKDYRYVEIVQGLRIEDELIKPVP